MSLRRRCAGSGRTAGLALRYSRMKIATFNINNVNKRLANLVDWLAQAQPDVACLQELKASDAEFPIAAIRRAGYEAVWRGQKTWNGVAILSRGFEPVVTRTELPGDPSDTQSRYIEAAVNGVLIGCLYAPNGNPQPGPKFIYKLAWLARLASHAATLHASGAPVVLAGDFNVVPTERDIYPTKSWKDDALVQPESRQAFRCFIEQGWMDAIRALQHAEPMGARRRAAHRSSVAQCGRGQAPGGCGRRQGSARHAGRERPCAGLDRVARRRQGPRAPPLQDRAGNGSAGEIAERFPACVADEALAIVGGRHESGFGDLRPHAGGARRDIVVVSRRTGAQHDRPVPGHELVGSRAAHAGRVRLRLGLRHNHGDDEHCGSQCCDCGSGPGMRLFADDHARRLDQIVRDVLTRRNEARRL
jgi:exodeoxyribonuclease III